jgi:hypothetical protein
VALTPRFLEIADLPPVLPGVVRGETNARRSSPALRERRIPYFRWLMSPKYWFSSMIQGSDLGRDKGPLIAFPASPTIQRSDGQCHTL